MSELLLGVRLAPENKLNVIRLNDVDLRQSVTTLRTAAAQQTNLPETSLDLIYCGCLLENDSTLESCGLKNGSMVHVLKKKEIEQKDPSKQSKALSGDLNDKKYLTHIGMIKSVFKSFFTDQLLELALRRLTRRPEVIENIVSSCPGLSEDPVAIAILQDPDLIVHFTDFDTMTRVANLHPALLDAAQHIASAVHEEAHAFAASSSTEPTSTGRLYSLDHLSDDEEMAGDSSQSSDSTQPSASQSRAQINTNMLASAISRAQRSNSARTSSSGSLSNLPQMNSNNGVITVEMFNQAMLQAVASSSTSNPPNPTLNSSQSSPSLASLSTPPSTGASTGDDLQRQISLMHDLGLLNDATNIQALQVTNGDVQAAIELVLSGFGDN